MYPGMDIPEFYVLAGELFSPQAVSTCYCPPASSMAAFMISRQRLV